MEHLRRRRLLSGKEWESSSRGRRGSGTEISASFWCGCLLYEVVCFPYLVIKARAAGGKAPCMHVHSGMGRAGRAPNEVCGSNTVSLYGLLSSSLFFPFFGPLPMANTTAPLPRAGLVTATRRTNPQFRCKRGRSALSTPGCSHVHYLLLRRGTSGCNSDCQAICR